MKHKKGCQAQTKEKKAGHHHIMRLCVGFCNNNNNKKKKNGYKVVSDLPLFFVLRGTLTDF